MSLCSTGGLGDTNVHRDVVPKGTGQGQVTPGMWRDVGPQATPRLIPPTCSPPNTPGARSNQNVSSTYPLMAPAAPPLPSPPPPLGCEMKVKKGPFGAKSSTEALPHPWHCPSPPPGIAHQLPQPTPCLCVSHGHGGNTVGHVQGVPREGSGWEVVNRREKINEAREQ